ncbi:hypothetical protein ACFL6I_21835 [candidate division KSB1 bacterium]
MRIKKEIETLHNSKEFKDWKEKNKESYISYALFMTGEKEDNVEIGYYNKKNDKVTTFVMGEKGIEIKPEENVFKKPGMEVEELDVNEVKIDIPEATKIADNLQKTKYPAELPMKLIMILQKLSPLGNIYNVTFVTKTFKTLNIKIDSSSGDVVEDRLVELMQFPGKE